MSQQLDTLARIALCDAVRHTYNSQVESSSLEVNMLMVQLEVACQKAFELYDMPCASRVGRILDKLDTLKRSTTIEKPKSIIILIEVALAIIDEPCRRCTADRSTAINLISSILLQLRSAISGGRDYALSSIFAGKIADEWEAISI